ncbi:MAG: hypothetical protein ACTH2Q_11680 [Propionibacteriaceae bacterium]
MGTYELRPAPPLRALAIGAVITLVGAVLLVLAVGQGWSPAVLVLGALVALLGLVLDAVALIVFVRTRVRVELDRAGFRVVTTGTVSRPVPREQEGVWGDIARATVTEPDGTLVLEGRGAHPNVAVVRPRRTAPDFDTMVNEVTVRLRDRSKN